MSNGGVQFRSAITIAAGLVIASGVAAAILALMFGDIRVFTGTFIVVAAVAVVLGLPVYLAARAARNDTPLVAAVMGFIVGAAVPAFLVLVTSVDQASTDGTATVINGSYTLAGWLENLALIGLFGLLGVGGALVFWLIARRSPWQEEQDTEAAPVRPHRTALLAVAAAGVIATAFVIPYATKDRSCHNPLRGGGSSIGQVASFNLRVGVDQWRHVEKELDAFRRSGGWSVRSDVRPDDSFPWLQISLCREPGTNIFVSGLADRDEINFGVYQPQGGSSWRPDFRALYDRINARWPTKIVFKDDQGNPTTAPAWVAREQQ